MNTHTNTSTRAAAALAAAALLAFLAGCAGTATVADTSVKPRSLSDVTAPQNLRQAIEADRPAAAEVPSLSVPNLRQAMEADRPAPAEVPSLSVPNLRQAIEADRGPDAVGTAPFNLRQLMESDH